MKKNLKNGFSLAEILIALGIISVIATMGFSVAKRGIAEAYKGYFFTGYQGLESALAIAKQDIWDNKSLSLTKKRIKHREHIAMTLNLKVDDKCAPVTGTGFNLETCYIAPNGIRYLFSNAMLSTNQQIGYNIIMQVPSVKTAQVIVPYRQVQMTTINDKILLANTNYHSAYIRNLGFVNLATRKDLLAFKCVKEPHQIIHDCTDTNETKCEISVKQGKTNYLSWFEAQTEKCEEIRSINPKYAF